MSHMSTTHTHTLNVPTDTCLCMRSELWLANQGISCERPAVALWLRGNRSPLPVCAEHAVNKPTITL